MAEDPRGYPGISGEVVREVDRIVRSGALVRGVEVSALEEEFAAYVHAKHAVAVNSGTAALHLALLAYNVGKDDIVVTSTLCIPAVASAIVATGAWPVLCDVNPYTYNMSNLLAGMTMEAAVDLTPGAQRVYIKRREALADMLLTRGHVRDHAASSPYAGDGGTQAAIVAVDLFGQPCEHDTLAGMAALHGMAFIEVAWDALGAWYDGAPVGSCGTACFSFQQGMAINAGEGGMLTTDDDRVAEAVRRMANFGCDCCGQFHGIGFNYRMTEMAAVLARGQLRHIDLRLDLVSHWAQELDNELRDLPGVVVPAAISGGRHAFRDYVVRITPEFGLPPAEVCRLLQEQGIHAVHRPLIPLHRQPGLAKGSLKETPGWNADTLAEEFVSLPLQTHLDGDSIAAMVAAIRAIAAGVEEKG